MEFNKKTGRDNQKITSILDSIDSIVYVTDIQSHRVLFANRRARSLMGDITGYICWHRIWNQQAGPCEPCRSMKSLNGGSGEQDTVKQALMNGGNGRCYEISGNSIEWSNGRMARLEVASDITERKLIEEMNRRSIADWENTFDTIDDIITIQDRDYNIIRANKKAEKVFGIPLDGILKLTCYELFHGKCIPPKACRTCKSLESKKTGNYEYYEPHMNKHLEVKVIPRLNQSSHIEGLVHIVKDITDRKEKEHELVQHKKKLSDIIDEKTSRLSSTVEKLNSEIQYSKKVEEDIRITEKKYRYLFEHAPDMYHSLNTEMIITDCNQTEARMLGYKKSEIVGRHLSDFFTEESKKFLATDFPKLKKKKSLKNLARTYVRKDGTTFPVILNVFADYDENGELVQTRAIARDISDLRKTERELQKANRMLKVLSECNNALLHIAEEKSLLDEICRIIVGTGGYRLAWVGHIDSNKGKGVRSAAYSGFDNNYIGMITSDWTASGSNDSPPWRAIESGRTSRARDIISCPKSGLWRSEAAKRGFSSLLAIPLFHKNTVEGVLNIYSSEVDAFNNEEIALLENLAENLSYGLKVLRSNTEKELARAETLRASHLASIGELAAGVAHEINNPINGIINYAQILVNKGKPDSQEFDIVKRIIRESDRIAGIVRNLLAFARDRNEGKVPTNMREVLISTIALTEAQIRKDGIRLHMDIPSLVPTITAQPQHLEQVFLNIISNARYALNQKYDGADDNKTLEIGINIHLVDKNHYLRMSFCDRGIGIPQNIIDKILNPFFSTKPSNVGTGLGLSISHGIVSDHGGKLLIDSVVGEYTRVTVELPICVKSRNENLDKVTI